MKTIIENGVQFDLTNEQFKEIAHCVYLSGDGNIYQVLESHVNEFMRLILISDL